MNKKIIFLTPFLFFLSNLLCMEKEQKKNIEFEIISEIQNLEESINPSEPKSKCNIYCHRIYNNLIYKCENEDGCIIKAAKEIYDCFFGKQENF